MMPRRADSEMAPMTATGMAMSRGQGVAITSTARKRSTLPLRIQAASATPIANGVYQPPSRSPSRRKRGRRCCVCSITCMMRA